MIAAVLSGPSYSSPNHDESTIEVFANVGEAVDALYERANASGIYPCTVKTLDGNTTRALFPTFGEEMRFTCFKASPMLHEDPRELTELMTLELLGAVHGGHWDYDVELVRGPEDLLLAQIEKAGMA